MPLELGMLRTLKYQSPHFRIESGYWKTPLKFSTALEKLINNQKLFIQVQHFKVTL